MVSPRCSLRFLERVVPVVLTQHAPAMGTVPGLAQTLLCTDQPQSEAPVPLCTKLFT